MSGMSILDMEWSSHGVDEWTLVIKGEGSSGGPLCLSVDEIAEALLPVLENKPTEESPDGASERPQRPELVRKQEPDGTSKDRKYMCSVHGEVSVSVYEHSEPDGTKTKETFCFRCIMDHLKTSPIARLGDD